MFCSESQVLFLQSVMLPSHAAHDSALDVARGKRAPLAGSHKAREARNSLTCHHFPPQKKSRLSCHQAILLWGRRNAGKLNISSHPLQGIQSYYFSFLQWYARTFVLGSGTSTKPLSSVSDYLQGVSDHGWEGREPVFGALWVHNQD